jgi:hypothetical protein
MLFLLIWVKNSGYFFSLLYIFVLSGLVAAAKQDDDFLPGILVIHPVTGSIVNTHFRDTLSDWLYIAGVPLLKPLNPGVDTVSSPLIPQVPNPLFINARFAYRHGLSVVYRQQIVKRIFKDFSDFLRDYFLSFLAGLAGSSGLAFGGRPLPGTLRTRSIVPIGYKASLVNGLIFCVWSLFSVAAIDIPKELAISVKVSPVIAYLPFLSVLAGGSGFLGGRPILIFFIISSVSGGYTAWRVMGFILALCMRASTVLKGKFKASHISLIVKPSISYISVIYQGNLINARKFLYFTKQTLSQLWKNIEKSARIFLYFVDIVQEISYNYK